MAFTGDTAYFSLILVLFPLILVHYSHQIPLASYIRPCPQEPREKLEECAVESANAAMPRIIKGDKRYRVPSFDPLHVTFADLRSGPNFDMSFTNFTVDGIQKLRITKASADIENKTIVLSAVIPLLVVNGPYKLKASIMVLAIEGEGTGQIILVNQSIETTLLYHLENRGGKEYPAVTHMNTEYKIDKAMFQFDNLLNGQKELGPRLNTVINDNWEVICNDMYKPMKEFFNQIIRLVIENYMGSVPFVDLFEK